MFVALLFMVIGIFFGRLLREYVKFSISPYIMVAICALLFVLGLEIGLNENLISKFAQLGLSAIVVSFLCVAGSCVTALLFSKMVLRKGREGDER